MADLVYVSDIKPGDSVEGATVASVEQVKRENVRVGHGMVTLYVLHLADGRSTVPMLGSHRYATTRAARCPTV